MLIGAVCEDSATGKLSMLQKQKSVSCQCQHPEYKLTGQALFTVGGVFSRKRRINRASSSAVILWLTMATSSSTSTV